MEQRARAEAATGGRAAAAARSVAPAARAATVPLGVGNRALRRLVGASSSEPAALALARSGLVLPTARARRPQPARPVSAPEDALELEADAVAARVVSGGTGSVPSPTPTTGTDRPALAGGREGGAPAGPPEVSPAVEALIASPGAGQALPVAVRARIEPVLAADLSEVRVHTGPPAQAAAASLQARAFTTGRDVFVGQGETPHDVGLMAHEATHVVQQGAAAQRAAMLVQREEDDDDLLDVDVTGWVKDNVAEAAAAVVPGYSVLAQVLGEDPITGVAVRPPPQDMLESLLTFGPFAAAVGPLLSAVEVLGDVVALVVGELEGNDLTPTRLRRDLAGAWDEFSVLEGVDGNIAILRRHLDALLADVSSFVSAIADRVIALVREVVVDLVEPLVSTPDVQPVWSLATKVFHHDPLRDVPVDAPTVEILAEFLTLVGRTETLAQLQANGALQEAADWIDTQWGTFTSIRDETGRLFADAWAALSPENLPGLLDTLPGLVDRGAALVRRVLDFGGTLLAKALELVKDALLVPLSAQARQLPGFTLLTVVLEQDPFTGAVVERTAENLLRGFFTLVPGGEQTYEQLAESGVIGSAASRITNEMSRLGISVDMITQTFAGVWDTLSLEDLLAPLEAFERVLQKFGEPLSRLVEFLSVVVEVVVTLVLEAMEFPSDLLASILDNAKAAMEDIQADPVGFLVNMLQALKAGFTAFLDNVVSHLTQGLTDWLFRGLAQLGITVPSDTSLQSVLDLVLQVIGVTAETLWTKLAARIGEERVAAMRGALDTLSGAWQFIKDVQERGISALWSFLADKLSSLWDTLLGMAKDWIVTEIVDAAAAKLLSMLDPTGVMAVVNSFIAFFRAVQSAVEYLREILELVEKYTRTIAQVAAGDIAPGAAMLEQGLAAAVPVAIGFLASQVGLGNVPEKVVEIIQGLRQLIDEALEWLFDQAMRLGQAALSALGVGGGAEEAGPGTPAAEADLAPGAESLPAGLPPDELKDRVLTMAASRLAPGVASIDALHAQLAAILTANREAGLSGLTAAVADRSAMTVVLTATASPPAERRLSWDDIFAASAVQPDADLAQVKTLLSVAGQATHAAIAVDGQRVGESGSSGGGVHAEEGLVNGPPWDAAIAAARAGVQSSGSAVITVLINRSPCISCVHQLNQAVVRARQALGTSAGSVTFRLAALGTYRRQARLSPKEWEDFRAGVQQKADRLGRPYDQLYAQELEFYKEDLRSWGTIWTDSADDVDYDGLSDLRGGGWELYRLDAGSATLKPRQLEMEEAAAELAAKTSG